MIANARLPAVDTAPWYRQFWPWFLIAGPLIVVIAATFTAWLAISTSDGLVAEEYYKEGLKASETIAQDARARAQGIAATLSFGEHAIHVRLAGRQESGFTMPPVVKVTLSHPTRAGVDQILNLTRNGDSYDGELRLPRSGHWLILIEDDSKSWRLMASVQLPAAGEMVIGGETPADIRSN
jgi:hypothetical protein